MSVPLAYLAVVVIWSTTPLALKWSGEDLGVLFGVSARMALGLFVCLLLLQLFREPLRWDRESIKGYLSFALGVFGAMLMIYLASPYIPSGMIAVIFGLTPIFTGIFASLLIPGYRIHIYQILAMMVGVSGLATIFSHHLVLQETDVLYGMTLAVLATATHGLSTVLCKQYASNMSALSSTTGGLMLAVPAYLLVWLTMGESLALDRLTMRTGVAIVYLGIFGSAFAFLLFLYALKNVDAMKMALIPLITPVFALLLGLLFNNEMPTPEMLTGSGLIISGLVLFQWGDRLYYRIVQIKRARL